MRSAARTLTLATVVAVTVGSAVALLAQNSATSSASDGSLAAVVHEIRQLRLAIEESARTQSQAQALTTYLSVQQMRLSQTTARRDDARRELDSLVVDQQNILRQLSELDAALPLLTDPRQRDSYESLKQNTKRREQQIAAHVEQARGREAELAQVAQDEEARWSELVGRLEQLTRR